MKEYAVTINQNINQQLLEHLLAIEGQEDLCFATYLPSSGKQRTTAVLQELILPLPGERNLHGNVSFTAAYLERALAVAASDKRGLAFLHSHVGPGWQGMSDDDVVAEKSRIAPSALAVTEFPLVGLTAGTDGAWSARYWIKDAFEKRKYNRKWCDVVKVVGKSFLTTFCDHQLKPRIDTVTQLRTISAWGQAKQEDLSRLRIAIVGLGSVGSMIAEILARIGITRFVLIDFDSVEQKNLDRLTNVFRHDIGKSKVSVVAQAIRRSSSASAIDITPVEYSICEEQGFTASLDCDLIFSCVDRPWPRQVQNFIAFAHLIPVIDGGILVRTNHNNTLMKGADWRAHIAGHSHMCLECIGQYSSERAKLEREGYIDDPLYLKDYKGPKFDFHENVFAFSSHLASSLVLQFLSYFIAPSGVSDVGRQMYHFTTGTLDTEANDECKSNCFFPTILGRTHYTDVVVTGPHPAAQAKRAQRRVVQSINS
jgi:molybdopterin/thiamine biosynthesis adenylyltransferase